MADQCVKLQGHFFIKSFLKGLCKMPQGDAVILLKMHKCTNVEDPQCRFCPGRSTMDQIFPLKQVFEKTWEYAKEMYTCFEDLKKAYDCVPRDKLCAVLLEYDVGGQLLAAIKSLYKQSKVCVCVNSMKTKSFNVSAGL